MQISKELDYATQLMLALTKLKEGELLSLKTFSKESNISFLFLQRIASSLKKAKLIDSGRGVRGGYFLTKKHISVKEIVAAVEGNDYAMTKCLTNKKLCKKKDCPAKKIFSKINQQLNTFLEATYIDL